MELICLRSQAFGNSILNSDAGPLHASFFLPAFGVSGLQSGRFPPRSWLKGRPSVHDSPLLSHYCVTTGPLLVNGAQPVGFILVAVSESM